MKLGYRTYKKEEENTGVVNYGARLVTYSKIGELDIVRLALSDSNINAQDLAVGFSALTQAIHDFVLNGHSVTLDGLGTFRLSCKTGVWEEKTKKWKSAGKTVASDVSANDIRSIYVRFKPCTALREKLNGASFFDVTRTAYGKQLLGQA